MLSSRPTLHRAASCTRDATFCCCCLLRCRYRWEFRGTPFDNPALYDAWNPSRHVSKWSTPMLVIHGGLDFRIGEAEGIATFTALQRRGVASRMVYFSDENHWVLKPLNSLRWHAEVLRWLEMHLKA